MATLSTFIHQAMRDSRAHYSQVSSPAPLNTSSALPGSRSPRPSIHLHYTSTQFTPYTKQANQRLPMNESFRTFFLPFQFLKAAQAQVVPSLRDTDFTTLPQTFNAQRPKTLRTPLCRTSNAQQSILSRSVRNASLTMSATHLVYRSY
ncbi:hypothetical protein E2C01_039534 [Portunus trituberculatus]|uniref:Uncharacterized protein n=1 Tax=Portunus trituberculatus TaxID=210409 RepID=A0A5B7FLL7_PORTR|nr:hypothetical protein [Portunus trituberculatus]